MKYPHRGWVVQLVVSEDQEPIKIPANADNVVIRVSGGEVSKLLKSGVDFEVENGILKFSAAPTVGTKMKIGYQTR